MQCSVQAGEGVLAYELTRKKVKNLNMRVRPDGSLAVSAPRWAARAEIDRFVASRAAWVERTRARLAQRPPAPEPPACALTDEQCMAVFQPFLDRYYPIFAPAIGGGLEIKLKTLKSLWGVCRPAKRQITLNRRLAEQPAEAVEYVVLHEYLHFWHPDHGKGFHRELDRLMPDNRSRRALLLRR